MRSFLTLSILLGLHLSLFSQTWIQKDSIPNQGVSGLLSFSISGKLYAGGGYNGSTVLNGFYEYDPAANTWTAKANLPVALESAGFTLHGKGYMVCGYGTTLTRTVYMYDPGADTWTAKNTFPGTARQNHTAFSVNGKGYICGGFTGGATVINELWQ